eukprot:CAMPEP_0116122170 /NCGR_PEP_ID=MMETSP0329-20121206/4074_1 /TAXON_ID=697910 /ORGANISM="Pseudo-nitzschia arenysensis, Strain B593" /LENGTH=500 /DNA_ID=CAMNT_0003616005 /DNA_START=279 /DNA_END=1780 /DNA_ORIENTATION=-
MTNWSANRFPPDGMMQHSTNFPMVVPDGTPVSNPSIVTSGSEQMSIESPETAERAWARELYEMNSDVREAVNNELHGVQTRAVPEDPAAIARALHLFQVEIDTQILPVHKQAAHKGPEFRLRFLRAERFDVKKAAIRYCRGLDYLVASFGEQALLRQLYLSDLSKEEERFLKKGLKQILPTRDRFGRRLMAHFGSYSNEYSFCLRAKVVTYLCFGVLAEDLTTQRNGVVSLGFFSYDNNDLLVMERKGFLRFFQAVPLRWSGFHLCIPNNPAFNLIKGLMLTVIPKEMRRITRLHSGTNLECEYSLRCFGIPTDDIPRTCTGKIKTKYLAKWMRVRTAMDDHRRIMAQNDYNSYYAKPPSVRAFPGIECPEVNCVLFRLAGLASTHPGNVEFRLFLQDKEKEREQLKTLQEKDNHLHQIIKETADRGFRFLVFDENRYWYEEITDYKVLRKHIFQAQRDIVKRAKARASVQMSKSNTAAFTSLYGGAPQSRCGTNKKNKK